MQMAKEKNSPYPTCEEKSPPAYPEKDHILVVLHLAFL